MYRFGAFAVITALLSLFLASTSHGEVADPAAREILARGGPVLVVVAHPDDDTCMSGIFGYFRERNIPVYTVVITRGEGSLTNLVDGDLSHLIYIRPREEQLAAKRYGARGVMQLKERDVPFYEPGTKIPTHDLEKFLKSGVWNISSIEHWIHEYAERVQPRQVLTMLNTDRIHAHHQAASWIVRDLARRHLLGRRLEKIYGTGEIDWYPPGYFDGIPDAIHFPITPFSNVLKETYSAFQLFAARAYASQESGHTPLLTTDEILYPEN